MRRLTVKASVSCALGIFIVGASVAPASATDCGGASKAEAASHAWAHKHRVASKIIGNGKHGPVLASKIIGNGARVDPREAAAQ
jgi:hypothetical protein